jgi:DNA repair protein RecN (Recombination protein N)
LLTKLSIQNYALINDVTITFPGGFTTITGETGAGKSILLGGLGLVLGNRADSSTLMDKSKKCIIEAEFNIANYNINSFFEKNDLDYDETTFIRRELLPSGKSRAFINDTPVKLNLLNELQNQLIDIHSQHQTLQLNDAKFQFQLVDALAGTRKLVDDFIKKLQIFKSSTSELELLKEQIRLEKEQHDYHTFLYDELVKADFKLGEQEELELKLENHSNSELIQQNLNESYAILTNEELGVLDQLYKLKSNLEKIKTFAKDYNDLSQRLETIYIDLKDIENELEVAAESVLFEPGELERINSRLQLLYGVLQKHSVQNIDELLQVKDQLSQKVTRIANSDRLITDKEIALFNLKKELLDLGKTISDKRKAIIPDLEKKLTAVLKELGMPEARFKIVIDTTNEFYNNGVDRMQWLFSANKGSALGSIKQIASGGELSRIMLAIKSIMAVHTKLPTILFDEIDTGVSGEIALKMGEIMQRMSQKMQVISITHLPQIAAKGKVQMKVFKFIENQQTQTNIKLLDIPERITEIAEMLGGKNITDTAEKHALQLLQLKK